MGEPCGRSNQLIMYFVAILFDRVIDTKLDSPPAIFCNPRPERKIEAGSQQPAPITLRVVGAVEDCLSPFFADRLGRRGD
jgi:hypothetical protein